MSELADKIALECRYHVLSDCVTLKSGSFKKFLDELRTLESELARLRKGIEDAPHAEECDCIENCTVEIERLRELVKRHEDALEWVSASKNHMKKSEGDSRGMFESWYGVGALSATHLNIRFADTPLAAIEAAMKEEK